MAVPDPQEFRQAVAMLPAGVTVIAAFGADGPAGATASAVCSLSLEPMMMLACLDRGSRTLRAVQHADRFAVNVLGRGQEEVARTFATKADHEVKWAAAGGWHEYEGAPVIDDCPVHLVCGLHDVIAAGDHVILTGDLLAVEAKPGEPLVHHGGTFRGLDSPSPG